jgi:hypothetical protein
MQTILALEHHLVYVLKLANCKKNILNRLYRLYYLLAHNYLLKGQCHQIRMALK